ncbi:MAG: hypothetical protein ACKO6E_05965 [Planctomycetota bacterium]
MRACLALSVPLLAAASVCVANGPGDASATGPTEMRIASELVVAGHDEPLARSLTLFQDGVAWDFLESAPVGSAGTVVEIVLHDPARERVVVIDPVRHVKTQVDLIRLERLSVSLAKWARSHDDRLVRWAGGPDFSSGLNEGVGRMELSGPRAKYVVVHEPAPTSEAAEQYRRFADAAILLKALLQPGGLPPYPRLAINERIAAAGGIPVEVALEIDPRLAVLGGPAERLRCTHRLHPRLLDGDIDRIEEAKGHVAVADEVPLAAYVHREAPDPRSTATMP